MNKIHYILLILILPVILFVSCDDDSSSLLDREDVGDLFERDVFVDPVYATYFVADIYYNIPGTGFEAGSGWQRAYLDCATDNGEARRMDSYAQLFNTGNWNANRIPLATWAHCYAFIRECNTFLKHYDKIVPDDSNDQRNRNTMEYLKGEVYFLRAYYYAYLAKCFGGVPLIDEKLDLDSEKLKAERPTFAETIEFIVNDCEMAEIFIQKYDEYLEGRPSGVGTSPSEVRLQNYGKANLGVVKALKAKVLLMAASPLFNRPSEYPGDLQYDSSDPNKACWRYPDYDRNRWRRAANAAAEVINLKQYSLFSNAKGTKTAYETLFTERAPMDEVIYPYLRTATSEIYQDNLPFEFLNVKGRGTPLCYNLPTQELVDAYEMKNGMLPEQEGSGFRPLNPYKDRDPRFESTIWHDESVYAGVKFNNWRREITSHKGFGKHYITGYSRTGYYLKKYMDIDQDARETASLPNTYPILRYADILLGYAEALNEFYNDPASAPGDSACWAVNQVRQRAGMPTVNVTFANRTWNMNQENLRKLIRNERRVEFAFEEHRFWDIRRWMIGEETQKIVSEMDIILKDNDLDKVYTKKQFETRRYTQKMNLLPIPMTEVKKNPKLYQNWGWNVP